MNRVQEIAAGSLLVLGAWLRPGGWHVSAPAPQAPTATVAPKPPGHAQRDRAQPPKDTTVAKGEGPWVASCKYWEPARSLDTKNPTNGCEGGEDRWGIPLASKRVKPEITAIIAGVPDPVHTHLSLEYDRQIDALMQAGADNGYLQSFYWMPWKVPTDATRTEETVSAVEQLFQWAEELPGQEKREEQPGLVVLKHVAKGKPDLWTSYNRVVYLFLVGESPALGMNGAQLRNALRYEKELQDRKDISFKLSMRGEHDLAIIGSEASGAAASLREAVEGARTELGATSVHIAGETDTSIANSLLNEPFRDKSAAVNYVSFGPDMLYERCRFLTSLQQSGYKTGKFALLVEDGTVYGESSTEESDKDGSGPKSPPSCPSVSSAGSEIVAPLVIRFPREISLLRNAQKADTGAAGSVPSPYLHLTLKDPVLDDTIPHFSTEQTPASQEAALMSIQRELSIHHVRFLVINASNILDEIFLANFLHRACPDVRLVFLAGGDLLMEREAENHPYIGSLTVTPYDLVGLWDVPGKGLGSRAFPDSRSEAMYNAASYIFHDGSGTNPILAGYQSAGRDLQNGTSHASLWATLGGTDGYYPLGIVSTCASNSPYSLPSFTAGKGTACTPGAGSDELEQFKGHAQVFPSLLWTMLSAALALYCVMHIGLLLSARYWSPFTRDLAIGENDQPGRRSVYMNIGAVMLFLMAWVLDWPVFAVSPAFQVSCQSRVVGVVTLVAGGLAVICTLWMTREYAWRLPGRKKWKKLHEVLQSDCISYLFFNGIAVVALFAVMGVWYRICATDLIPTKGGGEAIHTDYGMFFSYRCLHPGSGVSPAVPVFLVLLGWYLWAVCQTYRLRFSRASRPRLPGLMDSQARMFVSDYELAECKGPQHSCLYENITCLLITREMLQRFFPNKWKGWVSLGLVIVFVLFFVVGVRYMWIESVDRVLLEPGRRLSTLYERLITGLLVPLGVIALTGWLRTILVWGALRRGLLERLEMSPLRGAFTRLKGLGWMAMMRETGLHLRWRDMARTRESIQQLMHDDDMRNAIHDPSVRFKIDGTYQLLIRHLQDVRELANGKALDKGEKVALLSEPDEDPEQDVPDNEHLASLAGIQAIEKYFALICELLLDAVLVPYWAKNRSGFVESVSVETAPVHARRKQKTDERAQDSLELHAGSSSRDPEYIRLIEELVALRYVSLIRAVLGNIRYLMTFVTAVFVVTLVAWNSYPFQPQHAVDWTFTLAFLLFGGGIVWVFAQMHRNAILSRITDTSPNELGLDFYWRLVTFGTIPLLTWLTYQFPQIGSGIFRMVQPGLGAVK